MEGTRGHGGEQGGRPSVSGRGPWAPPDLAVFDELLAPDFHGDRVAGKAFAIALDAAIREQVLEVTDLVAEGDVVFVRFGYRLTDTDLSPVFAAIVAPATGDRRLTAAPGHAEGQRLGR